MKARNGDIGLTLIGAGLLVFGLLLGCSRSNPTETRKMLGGLPATESSVSPEQVFAEYFKDLPDPSLAPLPYVPGTDTIVVLPDTQVYTDVYPATFEQQTRWIAETREERNTKFVIHLGDVTERSSEREWKAAVGAMAFLDKTVPYSMAAGNHDYGSRGGSETRSSLLSTFFPITKQRLMPTFGGTFLPGEAENSFHLFSAGGRDWIVVVLEWGPRPSAITWANRILLKYKERTAIIVTHAYLFHDNSRYDQIRDDQPWNPHHYPTSKLPGGVTDGEELWQTLVSLHGNIAMVLCGHVLGDGAGYLASRGAAGNTVHQMLSNYQMLPGGGSGFLRLLELLPDGKTVQVKSYSPVLDDYKTGEKQQYVIDLDVRLGVSCLEGGCESLEGFDEGEAQ